MPSQQAHNIEQRCIDVDATSWRRIDVDTLLIDFVCLLGIKMGHQQAYIIRNNLDKIYCDS